MKITKMEINTLHEINRLDKAGIKLAMWNTS